MKAKSTQRQISKIYRYVLIFLLKLFYLGSWEGWVDNEEYGNVIVMSELFWVYKEQQTSLPATELILTVTFLTSDDNFL